MLEIVGYASALLIGVSLGLIGGGGSILAVPVLAYLFMLDEKVSTAYSLFIVGFAALVGGIQQHFKKLVDWRTAIVFGIPAIAGVWIVRHYVVPALPDVMFTVGDFEFTRRMFMFGLFAILMLLAAYSMLKEKKEKKVISDSDSHFDQFEKHEVKYNYPLILIEGIIVGGITGLVGAGGGFLIIPALVVLANVEMKTAVGTSLIIIAVKSILGFLLGDALTMTIDWSFLMIFTAIALAGIFIGTYLSHFIDGEKLKKGFGVFVIIMGIFIFIMEFYIKQAI